MVQHRHQRHFHDRCQEIFKGPTVTAGTGGSKFKLRAAKANCFMSLPLLLCCRLLLNEICIVQHKLHFSLLDICKCCKVKSAVCLT